MVSLSMFMVCPDSEAGVLVREAGTGGFGGNTTWAGAVEPEWGLGMAGQVVPRRR